MAALLCNRWFTVLRVLIYGALSALIFVPPQKLSSLALIAGAVAGATGGVVIGFRLFQRRSVMQALSRLGGHHYSLIAMTGFALTALWAMENGILWPIAVWFAPAGVLEAFVSGMGLARRGGAS